MKKLFSKIDRIVKNPKPVTPAEAGGQNSPKRLDCGLRHNDDYGGFSTSYETVKIDRLNIVSNKLFICFFLLILTIIVYAPIKNYEFINFDDGSYVYKNETVQTGLTAESIKWAFKVIKTDETAYWHPLAWLPHMLDCQLFGVNPGMHHLSSLFYHLLNTLLLFLVLTRMTGALWKSAFVAIIFALHPINMDSVVWISEKKNLLSTLFWLLTMLAYAHYASRPTILRYFLVLIAFALGLMAKPMLATLPCALLLLDFWPLYRFKWFRKSQIRENQINKKSSSPNTTPTFQEASLFRLISEKIPMLFLSFGTIGLSYYSLQHNSQIQNEATVPMALRISNALVSYFQYIWHLIWPVNYAIFYPFPEAIPIWKPIIAALALIILTALVIIYSKKKPYLAVGWLWFLGTLVPVIGLINAGLWPAMADRWAYVPFIGLFIIIAWGVPDFFSRFRAKKIILTGAAILSIIILAAATSVQLKYWKNSHALFQHAINVTQNNHIAHMHVGTSFNEKNNHKQALKHFLKAVEIKPNYSEALENAGYEFTNLKNYSKALQYYKKALLFAPSKAELFNKIGNAYAYMKKYDKAVSYYIEAIAIDSDDPTFYNNLGVARYFTGKFDQAIIELKKAIKIKPDYSEAYYNLGLAQGKTGNSVEATRSFLKAVQLDPDYKEAHSSLAKIYYTNGTMKKALVHYTEELRISPKDATAHFNTGVVLFQLKRPKEAVAHFQEALRLKPDYDNAKKALNMVKNSL